MDWWWRKLKLGLGDDDEAPFNLTVLVPRDQMAERLEWRKAHRQPCRIRNFLVNTVVMEVKAGWTVQVSFDWVCGLCVCDRSYGCKCGASKRDKIVRELVRIHLDRLSKGYAVD